MTEKQKIKSLVVCFFLFAIGLAHFAYVESTFLNKFFTLKFVGITFLISYLITFFVINEYPKLIARFNNLITVIASLILEILSLLIFIYSQNNILIFLAFILYIISTNLIGINLDIFLEAYTINVKTGKVRGFFYTIYNLGWVVSPILAGRILDKLGFNWLFGLIIILSLLMSLILAITFKKFKNHYLNKKFYILKTLKEVLKRPNLKKIFIVAFLLQIFYAVMVVYTPLYLNQIIGLNWSQIGLIFSIMLLPFVLLQYPAGYLADKYWGEKEILTAGLFIMALASFLIFTITSKSLFMWAIILFFSRIGASLTEIMRDTYFFKKVNYEDLHLINSFRSTTPLAYILVPIIINIILSFLSLNYIFLILGLIMITGLYFSLTLKDTK